jgi:toxin secretion/phage lysis holin
VKDFIETMQIVFAAIGGYLGYTLGGCDGFLYALVAFITLDYVTGVMLAVVEKKLSSEIGFRGIFKKVLIFVMVAIGHIIDSKIIGTGSAIRTAVIFFYASNEGISILENATKLGLPIPDKLRAVLDQIGKGDGKDGH